MRRMLPVVLAALLAALLLLPTGAAAAATGAEPATATQQVLAAEEGGPVGPSPNPTSSNAPENYDPPFLINAAVGLTALLVGLVAVLGGLYWLLVVRPRNAT